MQEALCYAELVQQRLFRIRHEPDFEFLAGLPEGSLILDIGANRGQTAITIKSIKPSLRVLSLEANPACEPYLRFTARLLSACEFRILALGSTRGELPFHVPADGGFPLLQEGTFDRGELDTPETRSRIGANFRIETTMVAVETLDGLGLSPAVIKIDAQGFELDILRGAGDTILRCSPVIIHESNSRNVEIHDLLARAGYRRRRYDHSAHRLVPARPHEADSLNWIYIKDGHPL